MNTDTYDNDFATIEFKPVCSKCGKEIKARISIEKSINQVEGNPFRFAEWFINPSHCPNCHAMFDSIRMPSKLPYDGGD